MSYLVFTRRRLLQAIGSASVLSLIPLARASQTSNRFTPEQFGARGDGQSDDSPAFAKLARHINTLGGGTVVLRPVTYRVGLQSTGSQQDKSAAHLLDFKQCTQDVIVEGRGACLQCLDHQRFGVFDRAARSSDSPTSKQKISRHKRRVLTPYKAMISAADCSGAVIIRDLELDGNLSQLTIGDKRGDRGWQIAANGLRLSNNTGDETISNVYSHHHALDGIYVDGIDTSRPNAQSVIERVRCEYNARQGMSIVGGRGYLIRDSRFAHTGRSKIYSAPGAGVDIEAERGKKIRRLVFERCIFADNKGVGLVADTGDSQDVDINDCRFIGTTAWSAWPRKPKYRFADCLFVGAIVNAYGSTDRHSAARFTRCVFRDDPSLSPTGDVRLPHSLCASLAHSNNALFDQCQFLLDHDGVLPWSRKVIYQDCVMRQKSTQTAHTRGTFKGLNRIDGPVDIDNSKIVGQLIINGHARH